MDNLKIASQIPCSNKEIILTGPGSEKLLHDDMSMRFIRIAINLSQEKDLKKLMNLITNEVAQLTSATRVSLYLVDHERQKLIFYVTDQKSFSEVLLPLTPESIAGYVGVTGKMLLIDDVYELSPDRPYKFNKSFDQKTGFRTKSMVVVPLFSHKNEVLGILQLINKQSDGTVVKFTESDLEVINAVGSLAAVSIENTLLYKEIENLFDSFVKYSATAIDERDPCTGGHSRRVAMYAVGLAAAMGSFSQPQIKEIKYAAWLHDIGKIGVKEAVLNKANKLTDQQFNVLRYRLGMICEKMEKDAYEDTLKMVSSKTGAIDDSMALSDLQTAIAGYRREIKDDIDFIAGVNIPGFLVEEKAKRIEQLRNKKYIDRSGQMWEYITQEEFENLMVIRGNLTEGERTAMESHVSKTYEILKQIPFTRELKNVAEFAGKHHEKLNGSGYPTKIIAPNIPPQVRIITISDIYDALVSQDRPYKKAMTPEVALKILNEDATAGKLDKDILGAFIEKGVYRMSDDLIQ